MSSSLKQKELMGLRNLYEFVDTLDLAEEDREKLIEAIESVFASVEHNHNVLLFFQDSISNIKHQISYLFFDLEATRRERDEYFQRLVDAGLEPENTRESE